MDLLMQGQLSEMAKRKSALTRQDYLELICAGSYPEPLARNPRRRNAWYDNYVDRIVNRDAREVSRLAHLDRLPNLIRVLAANNAGEMVKARIGADSGIPETSVTAYIELLETLYLVHELPAWANNLTKRVTGRPKIALMDTGLAARLVNVTPAAMTSNPASGHAGGLFEAWVIGELRRQLTWSESQPRMYHFRDRNGLEVDVVLEDADRNVVGVEVKAASTVSAADFRGLAFLRDKLGAKFKAGVLLHSGGSPLPFGDRLWALPCAALWG